MSQPSTVTRQQPPPAPIPTPASDSEPTNPLSNAGDWDQPTNWTTASTSYDAEVGLSTAKAAPPLIAAAHALLPLTTPSAWAIDLGAGTGSLTHALNRAYPDLPILATDVSPGMLTQLMSLSPDPDPQTSKITTLTLDMNDPITPSTPPASFTHVFSSMAMQSVPSPPSAAATQWLSLLRPGGVLALASWDNDSRHGPQEVWEKACRAVDPDYVAPPLTQPGQWLGAAALEAGLKGLGCEDVSVQVVRVGFDVGVEGFQRFFWENGNPWVMARVESFGGDKARVRREVQRVLEEEYKGGWEVPLFGAVAVGRKPMGEGDQR